MNANIEIINENLWGVDRDYVKAGYINELFFMSEADDSNPHASLTADGIMILNKKSELYEVLKKFIPRMMAYSDADLEEIRRVTNYKKEMDSYERLYLDIIEWEQKRRRVKKEYSKYNRKKGRWFQCHPFKQEYN
ncbi:MAG: hypothetical protein J6D02_09305 [Lachnospira sp.]|nr:hypothetical protein [Lachnospira sp.]